MDELLHSTINGRYRLAGRLGEGLFQADVVEGRKLAGRCALRLLQWSQDPTVPPFLPEPDAWQSVSHPGFRRTEGMGEVRQGPARGAMFLVHQLAALRRGDEDPVALARGLAEALQALHAAEGVHGRIKPANVLAGPLITDLGVVPARAREVLAHALHQGDVRWLAPEVLRGELGPPADMWGLGLTLLTALGFEPQPVPLDVKALRRMAPIPPTLPIPLSLLVAGCLQPDPERRWTAERVLALLDGGLYVPPPLSVPLTPATLPTPDMSVEARVRALALSPDARLLAAALQDGRVLLWADREPRWATRHPLVERMAWRQGLVVDGWMLDSGTGERKEAVLEEALLVGGLDGTVTGGFGRMVGHRGPVTGVDQTFSVSWDGSMVSWENGQRRLVVPPGPSPLGTLAVSNAYVAAGGPHGVTVWERSDLTQPVAVWRDVPAVALALSESPAVVAVATRRGGILRRPLSPR